jgi:Bacterial extracellular solute-binding proteins, family 5 Middle
MSGGDSHHLLAGVPGQMGSQIPLARPPSAAGGQLCHRPPSDHRGRDAGFRATQGQYRSPQLPYALALEPWPHDPNKAKQLLQEAGYPNGFDAGDITPFPPATPQAEAVANDLGEVGIKLRVRTMERPAMIAAWHAKSLQGVILAIIGALSRVAARLENYVVS